MPFGRDLCFSFCMLGVRTLFSNLRNSLEFKCGSSTAIQTFHFNFPPPYTVLSFLYTFRNEPLFAYSWVITFGIQFSNPQNKNLDTNNIFT